MIRVRLFERGWRRSWLLATAVSLVPLGAARAQETKAAKDCVGATAGTVAILNFVNGTRALVVPERLSLFIRDQDKNGPRPARASECKDDAQLHSTIDELKTAGVVLSLHAEERVLKHRIPQATAQWFPYQTWSEDDLKRYLERLRVYQAAAVALHDIDLLARDRLLPDRACVARSAKAMLEIAAGGLVPAYGADQQLRADLDKARGILMPMILEIARQGGGACGIPSVTSELFKADARLSVMAASQVP